jgi:ubiquitin-protein ligase
VTPRHRRLLSDLRQMEELAAAGELAFRSEGNPPETFHVMFSVPGLALDRERRLAIRNLHRCTLYLHREYPRRPPIVTWLTPVFHPNLLPPDRNGGVCIGSWSAAESLADLCLRLRDLVSYRTLNPSDALDLEAARWASEHAVRPGVDLRALVELPLEPEALIRLGGGSAHV